MPIASVAAALGATAAGLILAQPQSVPANGKAYLISKRTLADGEYILKITSGKYLRSRPVKSDSAVQKRSSEAKSRYTYLLPVV